MPAFPTTPTEPAVLCLDVGGSSVKSGVVLSGGVVVGPYRAAVNSSGEAAEILDALASALLRLRRESAQLHVRGTCMAMPGPFDYENGVSRMRGIGKYDAIYGMPLADAVEERAPSLAGLPWRWLNDANAFALGELRFGAAAGVGRAMILTLGTGCGSAFVVGGQLVTSGPGVPADGYVYPLLHKGRPVDELLSARGVERLWQEVASGDASEGDAGAGPSTVTAQQVGELAGSGDGRALEALRRFGALLAAALRPVFTAFAPEIVVLGGQVSRSLPYFESAAVAAGAPPLVAAAAPELSALRGAAAHFLDRTRDVAE